MSNFLNEQYNLSFSRQTIYNCNDNESDDYLKQKEELIAEKIENNGIDLTGYYGHDEAFFRLNGEEKSLLAMIDSNTQRIINTNIFPEETYRQHLETFIIYSMKDLSIYNDSNTPNPLSPLSLPDLEKHVLTGDGLREYPTIAAKANIDFHRCVFHLLMSQRIPVWKRQAIILRKIDANNLKMEKK